MDQRSGRDYSDNNALNERNKINLCNKLSENFISESSSVDSPVICLLFPSGNCPLPRPQLFESFYPFDPRAGNPGASVHDVQATSLLYQTPLKKVSRDGRRYRAALSQSVLPDGWFDYFIGRRWALTTAPLAKFVLRRLRLLRKTPCYPRVGGERLEKSQASTKVKITSDTVRYKCGVSKAVSQLCWHKSISGSSCF